MLSHVSVLLGFLVEFSAYYVLLCVLIYKVECLYVYMLVYLLPINSVSLWSSPICNTFLNQHYSSSTLVHNSHALTYAEKFLFDECYEANNRKTVQYSFSRAIKADKSGN